MRKILLATTVIIVGFALSSAAIAETPFDAAADQMNASSNTGVLLPTDIPMHPLVNEVDMRDNNQQIRIDMGVANGQLTHAQAAHDQARLNHQEAVQHRQEAQHGGHLTVAEYHHDNQSLNKSSVKIYTQRHK
jgi:hypothetical protein